jgi:hypothetical protein
VYKGSSKVLGDNTSPIWQGYCGLAEWVIYIYIYAPATAGEGGILQSSAAVPHADDM